MSRETGILTPGNVSTSLPALLSSLFLRLPYSAWSSSFMEPTHKKIWGVVSRGVLVSEDGDPNFRSALFWVHRVESG